MWADFFASFRSHVDALLESFERALQEIMGNMDTDQEQQTLESRSGGEKSSPEVSKTMDSNDFMNTLLFSIRLMRNMCVQCEQNQVLRHASSLCELSLQLVLVA